MYVLALITTLALNAVDLGSALIVGVIALPTTAPICGAFAIEFPGLATIIFVALFPRLDPTTVIPPPTLLLADTV